MNKFDYFVPCFYDLVKKHQPEEHIEVKVYLFSLRQVISTVKNICKGQDRPILKLKSFQGFLLMECKEMFSSFPVLNRINKKY